MSTGVYWNIRETTLKLLLTPLGHHSFNKVRIFYTTEDRFRILMVPKFLLANWGQDIFSSTFNGLFHFRIDRKLGVLDLF
jgi:hypothetical protein